MVPARIRLTINFSKRKGKKMKLSQTAFSFVLAAALVGGASSVFAADRYGTTSPSWNVPCAWISGGQYVNRDGTPVRPGYRMNYGTRNGAPCGYYYRSGRAAYRGGCWGGYAQDYDDGISAAAMAGTNNLSFKHPVTVLVF